MYRYVTGGFTKEDKSGTRYRGVRMTIQVTSADNAVRQGKRDAGNGRNIRIRDTEAADRIGINIVYYRVTCIVIYPADGSVGLWTGW
jgi:hypothetical protein